MVNPATDSLSNGLPSDELLSRLKRNAGSVFHALIMEFGLLEGHAALLGIMPMVRAVLYDRGPSALLSIGHRKEYITPGPKVSFRWYHLPANNVFPSPL